MDQNRSQVGLPDHTGGAYDAIQDALPVAVPNRHPNLLY